MISATSTGRDGERGSALVIATLVTVILTLLGVAFLLMADTENKIAQNEKLSAQALYFGEAGAKAVKRWFDRPRSTSSTIFGWNLDFPTLAQVKRDVRLIDVDGPGPTAAVLTDGNASGTAPYYKQGVDNDGDGIDDIFDRPYRPTVKDMLLGTAAGPDIRIDRTYSAGKTFLDNLSDKLLQNFPAAGANIRARLSQIDIYAPPYLLIGTQWTRYGLATVAVTAQILKTNADSSETILAQRVIRAVLNETPYPGPFGPIHSCNLLNWNGDLNIHWGTATAAGTGSTPPTQVPSNETKLATSFPRDPTQVSPKVDYVNGASDPSNATNLATFNALVTTMENQPMDDPWFRMMAGGPIDPYWTNGITTQQVHAPSTVPDHSNIYQNFSPIGCPDFDYETWKTIATSGTSDVHYFVWASGDEFKENGVGAQASFESLTSGATGLYFFDTKTASAPVDADGNGVFDNLTPAVSVQGTYAGFRGFIYLNAAKLTVNGTGSSGRVAAYTLPGEPYFDSNQNGVYDSGEPYMNLNYNSQSTTAVPSSSGAFRVRASDNFGSSTSSAVWNRRGPNIADKAVFNGIIYMNGLLDTQGNPRFLGSVITQNQNQSAGTGDFYWDPKLIDDWPPSDWDLPRVIITRWETDQN